MRPLGGRPGDVDVQSVAGLNTMAFHIFGRLSGVSPLVSGLPAPMVLVRAREPSAFFTSQPQPEPNVPTQVLANSSLNVAKSPNARAW